MSTTGPRSSPNPNWSILAASNCEAVPTPQVTVLHMNGSMVKLATIHHLQRLVTLSDIKQADILHSMTDFDFLTVLTLSDGCGLVRFGQKKNKKNLVRVRKG